MDFWVFSADWLQGGDDFFYLWAADISPIPPDAIAIGSGNLNVAPILSPGDLSKYDYPVSTNQVVEHDPTSRVVVALLFTFESVTLIPEPGTGLLVIAGLLGFSGWRRGRA